MRISLVHNPSAGSEDSSDEELLTMLSRAGYEATLYATKRKDLDELAGDPGEMVVIAGGDGTVRKVAMRLAGTGIPLAILPIGTANNISKSLGISGTPEQIIESWPSAGRKSFDLGVISSPVKKARFIEAVGLGIFTQAMSILDFIDDKLDADFGDRREKLLRDLTALKEILLRYSLQDVSASLDGKDVSGRYVMVEAMNTNFVGPNLHLAPEADHGDGYLDVVFVTDEERNALSEYLSGLIEGEERQPRLTVSRGRALEILWDGSQMHVDDGIWASDATLSDVSPRSPTEIKVELQNHALEFIL